MEVVKIEVKGNKLCVLSFLKGEVFHLTTKYAYENIRKTGVLFNNKDGQFRSNPSSINSFGTLFGYVSFFDLRKKIDSGIDAILDKYDFIRPGWFQEWHDTYSEWNLAYMILNPQHYGQLLCYEKVREHYFHSGQWLQAIPHAEAWIAGHVPIEWFSKTYIVRNKVRSPELGSYARALYDMELKIRRRKNE